MLGVLLFLFVWVAGGLFPENSPPSPPDRGEQAPRTKSGAFLPFAGPPRIGCTGSVPQLNILRPRPWLGGVSWGSSLWPTSPYLETLVSRSLIPGVQFPSSSPNLPRGKAAVVSAFPIPGVEWVEGQRMLLPALLALS